MVKARPLADRFWEKVNKTDGCWLWTGSTTQNGNGKWRYGLLSTRGAHQERASRLSWMFFNGDIPHGLLVCHRCDNPLCVNPSHLFLGTNLDNMRDMVSKGRMARGEGRPRAKFSNADVVKIRERYSSGERQDDIAGSFGTSQKVISRIVLGLIYRFAGGPIATKKRPIVLHGSSNGNALLSDEQVAQLRLLRDSGYTIAELAQRFSISSSTAHNVIHGRCYVTTAPSG